MGGKHFLFICFIIFIAMITCSCNQNRSSTNDLSFSKPTNLAIPSNSNNDYEIVSKTIYTNDSVNCVNFQIPQIVAQNELDSDCINTLIYEQSKDYILQFGLSDLYLYDKIEKNGLKNYKFILEGDYSITLCNEKILSIVFKGFYNIKTEPHPNNFSFSINIDFETKQLMDIDSVYELNEKFIELLLSYGSNWLIRTEQKEVIAEYFNSKLLKQALAYDDTCFYFTKNKFGIIINNLPYAIGNYCTYEIPNELIKEFKIA